jgi:hypothetical protein
MTDDDRKRLSIRLFIGGALGWAVIGYMILTGGCAPAPEWSGKPNEVPVIPVTVEWNRHLCTYGVQPPEPELRCLGDEPPVVADDEDGRFTPQVCDLGSGVCQPMRKTAHYWRCPVVLAETEFNK